MSNWDDEDYEVPVTTQNFDDEDNDTVLDSWEAAGDSEDEDSGPSAPTRNRVGAEQRKYDRERKEQLEREKKAMAAGEESAADKKNRLQKAEVDSDLNNAASLFGEVNLHPRERASRQASAATQAAPTGPAKLSDLAIFKPQSKQDFDNLERTLAPLLQELSESSTLHYSNFATDLARDICKPLSIDQIRKVSATLNALSSEKQREERMNRGKKKKPVVKAASMKVDEDKDTTNYDDFGDDDFM